MHTIRYMSRKTVAVLIGLSLTSTVAHADFIGFGDFSGFKVNRADNGADPAVLVSPTPLQSTIHLTGPDTFESRSIFFKTPQPTSNTFTARFTYQESGAPSGSALAGFAFVLQNGSGGFNAVDLTSGSLLGYGGSSFTPSVAIEFPLNGNASTLMGEFTNGSSGPGTDSVTPVNILSGDPIDVVITYDGSFLREFITDTLTQQSSPVGSHLISLPATSYVGLTAGNGSSNSSSRVDQSFTKFQFTTIPEPASVILIGLGGAGMTVRLRSRRKAVSR
jgi:hypothetical protein